MAKTISEFAAAHAPADEIRFLRARVSQLEARLEAERRASGEQRVIAMALADAITAAEPVRMQYRRQKSSGGQPVTHVLHLTDLHYGEVIEPREVENVNAFSPEIAERRLETLGRKIIAETETMRRGYVVPALHVLGTADYVSGDIHRELSVTNAFPSPVQAVRCGYALGALVLMLAPHFERVTLDMITLDNHGRMTARPQSAEGGKNNWGYVVGEVLRQYVARQPNVEVRVHASASALVEIGAERYLLLHGHQIRGWAGVPYYGFDRRVALEAVKRMALPERDFTRLVCGHFHVSVDSPHWMIGGSLSGTNAYDHGCGRHMRAHQTGWFVHPSHGQFAFTRWWL